MTGGINLAERIQTVTKKLADVNAEMAWEAAGTAEDVAGMVDPTPISDAIGAGIAIRNGDFLGAGLNVVGMVPYLGDALAKPIKATRAATKIAGLQKKISALTKELGDLNALKKREEAAELAAKEAKIVEAKKIKDAEKAAAEQEKAAAKAKDKDCEDCSKAGSRTKVMKQVKVDPCFSPKNFHPSKAKEFAGQLQRQENALNQMTVKEFNDARAIFGPKKRSGTGSAQAIARKNYEILLKDQFTQENVAANIPRAKSLAAEKAKEVMKTLAALHEPDMVAGGKDVVTNMGDRVVNSSIGGQWKNRVKGLDTAAKAIPEQLQSQTKMNVKLPVC